MLKITDLAQHLHQLRHNRSGRAIGSSMRVTEVWECVLESDMTSVSRVDLHIDDPLPRPVDGMFARVVIPDDEGETEIASIFVHRDLPQHWRDFIIVKEMMHCFTPMDRYGSTPNDAGSLLRSLVQTGGRYTLNRAADDAGIYAAAEVILPHKTVESLLASGQDYDQIAARHGLHPEIAHEICANDILHGRKNGFLSGDL